MQFLIILLKLYIELEARFAPGFKKRVVRDLKLSTLVL